MESTKKLLELTNECIKIAEYEVNMQKSIVFLHSSNKETKNKTRKTIPFILDSKRIKYL